MKRIDVMRQLSTEEMAMTLVSLLAPRIEQVTGKPLADEELEVAAESWVNWLESEHPETREKLYTRDILAVKFNKDETNFLSENDWDIIKALERMSKADPEGFMSEVLKLVKRQMSKINKMQTIQNSADKFARDLCKERFRKAKPIADFEDLQDYISKEKINAVKEFVEKLKTEIAGLEVKSPNTTYKCGMEDVLYYRMPKIIDRLVEEMGYNDG